MRQLKKVTRFFGVLALALLVFVLGFAAKHGQFEPVHHHGHFLAKSVKMESHHHDSHYEGTAAIPAIAFINWYPGTPIDRIQLPRTGCPTVAYLAQTLPLLV